MAGKYGPFLDQASFVIDAEALFNASARKPTSALTAASVITLYQGKPLLAISMTAPEARRQGYAQALIEYSLTALAKQGYAELCLAVSAGNSSAERL